MTLPFVMELLVLAPPDNVVSRVLSQSMKSPSPVPRIEGGKITTSKRYLRPADILRCGSDEAALLDFVETRLLHFQICGLISQADGDRLAGVGIDGDGIGRPLTR